MSFRTSDIEISTREFVFEHGREPKGRGSWAFDFGRGPEWIASLMNADERARVERAHQNHPTFAEARKVALRIARERAVRRVEVCS